MKIINAIWDYLKDWKNLLTHGIIGVLLVLVALVIPLPLIYRLAILAAVVALNLLRMNLSKKLLAKKNPTE